MMTLNGIMIKPTFFPDKTSQIWQLPLPILMSRTMATINWMFESESDIMHLAQLVSLLRTRSRKIKLIISYLPYARQDKPIDNESTFALHAFADILNHLEFDFVECLDPHSEIADRLINNFSAIYPVKRIIEIYESLEKPLLVYPDKGAMTKYSKLVKFEYITGDKVREPLRGKIIHYGLSGSISEGRNVLIVDDLCDGGATFIQLAGILKQKGAGDINLYITHGLFTRGVAPLFQAGIKRVFTFEGEHKSDSSYFIY